MKRIHFHRSIFVGSLVVMMTTAVFFILFSVHPGDARAEVAMNPPALEGVKFYDLNGNGRQDPEEPGLADWPIVVNGDDGLRRETTTDQNGAYEFVDLTPGATYTVTEVMQPGWVQTFPTTVLYTATLTQTQVVRNLNFGNTRPCENPQTAGCLAGVMDEFDPTNPEPASPSPDLLAVMANCYSGALTNFDEEAHNQCFGHTFDGNRGDTCLSQNCLVVGARLTIRMKPTGCCGSTDKIYFREDGAYVWGYPIPNLPEAGGIWQTGTSPATTFTLDLAALPADTFGTTNILATLQDGDLDILVQDDTMVDYITLDVSTCCDCTSPPAGMTAWWSFDELAGPLALETIAGHQGTHMNGPTPVVGEYVANALNFDGNDNYVNVPHHPDLNMGTDDFSIDVWVRTDSPRSSLDIVDKRSVDPVGYAFLLVNGRPTIQLADPGGYSNFLNAGGADLRDGEWHFLAVTVDRDDPEGGRIYVDGSLDHVFDPTGRAGSLDNQADFWVGRHHSNSSLPIDRYYEGDIDELELFRRVLWEDEVIAIYNAHGAGKCKYQCTPPPAGMVGWWPLDEPAPATAVDLVNGNDGTHANGPVPAPGMVAGALQFDGDDDFVRVPNSPVLNFGPSPVGDFSIDAWIYWDPNHARKEWPIVSKWDGNTGYELLVLDGNLALIMADGASSVEYHSVTAPLIPALTWTHVAVTVDRDNPNGIQFYIDGAPVGTPLDPTGQPGSLLNQFPLFIGASAQAFYQGLGWQYFEGYIDEVEIFDLVVPAADIQAIYDAGPAGKCKASIHVPWDRPICINLDCRIIPVTIFNDGTLPATFSIPTSGAVTGLPAGAHPSCSVNFSNPATYTVLDPPVTIPPGGSDVIQIKLDKPVDMVSVGDIACYQVTAQDMGTGQFFTADGSLVLSPNWCLEVIEAVPVGVTPVIPGSPAPITVVVTNTNEMTAVTTFSYTLMAVPNDMQGENQNVSLDGLPPGEPVTRIIDIPTGESMTIDFEVDFAEYEPFRVYDVLVQADLGPGLQMQTQGKTVLAGSGTTAVLYSVGVRSAHPASQQLYMIYLPTMIQ